MIFDQDSVMERLDGDWGLFWELFDMLQADYSEQIKEIFPLIEKGDITKVALIAHSLKSSFGNLGAMEAFEIAKNLEKECKNNCSPDKALELFNIFKDKVSQYIDVINKLR